MAMGGAAAGGLVGALDAVLSGAPSAGLVALYLAAVGLIGGGFFGGVIGLAIGLSARTSNDLPLLAARRRVWLSASYVLFVGGLLPITSYAFTAFRNQALAGLTLALFAPAIAALAAVAGGAVAGAFELVIAILPPAGRETSASRASTLVAATFVTLLAAALWTARHRFPGRDADVLMLAGLWLAGSLGGGRLLAARRLQLARLPRAVPIMAAVLVASSVLATLQVITRHGPRAVRSARPHLAVFRPVMPAPAEHIRIAWSGGVRTSS